MAAEGLVRCGELVWAWATLGPLPLCPLVLVGVRGRSCHGYWDHFEGRNLKGLDSELPWASLSHFGKYMKKHDYRIILNYSETKKSQILKI